MPTVNAANVTQNFPCQLTTVLCGECGGIYALNENYRRDRERDGKSWTCPYCKTAWGYCEGANDRLKREKAQLIAALDQSQAERKALERQAKAAKAERTKLRKRLAAGVCPCCHRTFKQLAAHMADVHPDFKPEAEEARA